MIKEAFIALFVGTCAHAHSLHQSAAEAEYNAKTKKLEVSLTVFINDLELALIRHSERMMALEKTPAVEFDAEVQAYLSKTFVITDAAGKVSKIEWVGRDLDADSAKSDEPCVTLYFQVSLPAGLGGVSLQHSVFTDLFKDQTNLLLLRQGERKDEWRFVHGEAAKKLFRPKQ
ncbi:MAG TPA: DUF6702 family protein [Prosthecobacter sp.]